MNDCSKPIPLAEHRFNAATFKNFPAPNGVISSGMTVHANQALVVTQEQLEQIRQLKQQEAVVTTVTAPGDILLQEHKALESTTKSALMQTAAKAAEHAAEKPPLDVSNTSQLRDLAQSAARIFGWDNNGKPGVQLNQQFVISQEQLEQIRQLRAVPEPEQLQERKNNEH